MKNKIHNFIEVRGEEVGLRLGIVSDSHGDLYMLEKAIGLMGKVDMLIHLGDHYKDIIRVNSKYNYEVHYVPGNNDYLSDGKSEKTIEVMGKRLFLTHGHRYNVNLGIMNLSYKAEELGADIVLFGHTHRYTLEYSANIFLLNPGSVSRPRDRFPSAAVLIINDNGDTYAEKINLNA